MDTNRCKRSRKRPHATTNRRVAKHPSTTLLSLPPELLQNIVALAIAGRPSVQYYIERMNNQPPALQNRIQLAGVNRQLRQCVLRIRLDIHLRFDRTIIPSLPGAIPTSIECNHLRLRQSQLTECTSALMTLCRPKVMTVIDQLGVHDGSTEGMLCTPLAGVLEAAAQPSVTHLQLCLTVNDGSGSGTVHDLQPLFRAISQLPNLQVLDLMNFCKFNLADAESCVRQWTGLRKLRALRLFGCGEEMSKRQLSDILNHVPTVLQTLCYQRQAVLLKALNNEAKEAVESVCCFNRVGRLDQLTSCILNLLKRAKNFHRIVVSRFIQNVTEERTAKMSGKILDWLEQTEDPRTKLEVVIQNRKKADTSHEQWNSDESETCSSDSEEEEMLYDIHERSTANEVGSRWEYSRGGRSIVVSSRPENGIFCEFDCFNEHYR